LDRATINRHLHNLGYDQAHVTRAPAAVRFQARHANELWQFDLSPSDLKEVEKPLWFEPGRGNPTLMLYSIVDERSSVAYQEYRCVYGEDVEGGLRFMFAAMAPKSVDSRLVMQGIPDTIYTDNGPIARSRIFQNVLESLGMKLMTHIPAGKDGRRTTARSKGKVERPFRTVKEAFETLFHFHKPENEAEATFGFTAYRTVQQPRSSLGTAFPPRGLAEESSGPGLTGDVPVGTLLRPCPRAGTAHGRRRRSSVDRRHRL
jgi:hypothetical protein